MNERDLERAIDAAVWARLATDSAYLNAENGVEQAAREHEISDEEYSRLMALHRGGDES